MMPCGLCERMDPPPPGHVYGHLFLQQEAETSECGVCYSDAAGHEGYDVAAVSDFLITS